MRLSARLSAIASLIPEGCAVVDVGTDHGYLPTKLFLDGKMKSITATDINEKPLNNARDTLKRFDAQGVDLILCDGLEKVSKEKADTVIIAGMGGEVISGILSRCTFIENSKVLLVLQPMTAAPELREYLASNGFFIEKEIAVSENKKVYSIMCARYNGTKYELEPAQKFIGILKPNSADSRAYIEKQYRLCLKCSEDIKNVSDMSEQYELYSSAAYQINKILEDYNGA